MCFISTGCGLKKPLEDPQTEEISNIDYDNK
jgi:predicted small lipoprotein YifL